MKTLTVFLLLSSTPVQIHALTIREALGQIESGDRDEAVGKSGEVSRFQIKPSVWGRYTSLQRYQDAAFAWGVAEHILRERAAAFEQRHKRKPTLRELYVCWNAPQQALTGKISRTVAERADRFANLAEKQ